jgi:predicted PurR-regulated permease PerM
VKNLPIMTLTQRNIAIAISLLLVGAIIYYFRNIVTYVLIAWVISTLGQPIMRVLKQLRLGKMRIPIPIAAALTLLFFAIIITGLMTFFVPMVVQQAQSLSQIDLNTVATSLEKPLSDLTQRGHRYGLIPKNETALSVIQHEATSFIKSSSTNHVFSSVVSTVGDLFVGLFAVIFISFFFLKENTMFLEFLSGIAPKEFEKNVREAVNDTTFMLSRYFSGILLQMTFVTIFLTVGMLILGVDNAILIAVFAALINIVPYLGPWMGCLFAFSVAISSNLHLDFYDQTIPLLFKIAFVFGLMQFFNDWIVQPLIFSNRVLAHPLEIFIVTLIGAKVGGIFGMVLAIPGYTVLRVIAREFFQQYRFVQKITKGLDDSGIV